jgi:ABC-type siderophore export system fused ATPase/permease subunit
MPKGLGEPERNRLRLISLIAFLIAFAALGIALMADYFVHRSLEPFHQSDTAFNAYMEFAGFAMVAFAPVGIVALLLSMGIGMRQVFRKPEGICPSCFYDLRGDTNAGCPECGWGRDDEVRP